MRVTTKIVADVHPDVKTKLQQLCKDGETMKDALIRVIEEAHKKLKK